MIFPPQAGQVPKSFMFSENSFSASPEGGGFALAFDIWPELSNRNLTTQFPSSDTSLREAENLFFFLDTNPLYGPTDFPFRSIAAAAGEIFLPDIFFQMTNRHPPSAFLFAEHAYVL